MTTYKSVSRIYISPCQNISDDNDEEDIFKDALSSEEDRKRSLHQLLNEFELSVSIIKQTTEVNCILSDMRFVFAVPTA